MFAALVDVLLAEAAFEPVRAEAVDFDFDAGLFVGFGRFQRGHFDLLADGVVFARVVRLAARLAVLLKLSVR